MNQDQSFEKCPQGSHGPPWCSTCLMISLFKLDSVETHEEPRLSKQQVHLMVCTLFNLILPPIRPSVGFMNTVGVVAFQSVLLPLCTVEMFTGRMLEVLDSSCLSVKASCARWKKWLRKGMSVPQRTAFACTLVAFSPIQLIQSR